jgi:hypothetical protein
MNNKTTLFPPFPLLTQPEDIRESIFCDNQNCDKNKPCFCVHRLKMKKDSIVEMTVIDGVKSDELIIKYIIDLMTNTFFRRRLGQSSHPLAWLGTVSHGYGAVWCQFFF